ncbi:glycosyltransferase family 2 protein [Lacticaseibacillus camelliae]|uniref:glycosyltransferase family 2 protein n=1 Tax=Lacticaseibacillus camelliae TaxID=381742 RepID=UPI0006CFECB9|nr:glycosyltransferase family 2 protein [Lacticaseibacillus camelliae]
MKTLSIIVPCYNAADYMDRCVDSLLPGGAAVEIILVDDGSTDATPRVIDDYARRYPRQVVALHQANAGHGGAINAGLKVATGRYLKVVDSDDWLDEGAFHQVLAKLTSFDVPVDLFISNYIYDKVGVRHKKVTRYRHGLPQQRVFGWPQVRLPVGQYLLMHALIYRTAVLRDLPLHLPTHTFYVDNLFALEPLPSTRRLYYLDVDLYHYYIGRPDQSVHESVMIKRIDQQLAVNRRMIKVLAGERHLDPHLYRYMARYTEIVTGISSILLLRQGTREAREKKGNLWRYMRMTAPRFYRQARTSVVGIGVNLPGWLGRHTSVDFYRLLQQIYHFN